MRFLVALNHSLDQGEAIPVRDAIALVRNLAAAGHEVTLFAHAEGLRSSDGMPCPFERRARLITVQVKHLKFYSPRRSFLNYLKEELKKRKYDRTIGMGLFPGMDLCVAYPEEIQGEDNVADRIRHSFYLRRKNYLTVLRPPSVSLVCCLTPLQHYRIANDDMVPPERLCVLPAGLSPALYGHHCIPKYEDSCVMRLELDVLPEAIVIMQYAESSWYEAGVDRSLYGISVIPDPWRHRCQYILIGNEDENECRHRLFVSARECNFPPAQCRYLNVRKHPLESLLPAADLYLHPAREDLCGESLVQALALGIPVVTSDTCGNCNYAQKAGCPVIPSPFRYETLQDALAFVIPSLANMRHSVHNFAKTQNFCGRSIALADAACRYHPVADHSSEFTVDRMRRIIALHRCHGSDLGDTHVKTIKDERKRSVSLVFLDGKKYVVKEFHRRPWWHFSSEYLRAICGTRLMRSFTPYCWGQHCEKDGSRYLIFRYCGEGNFFTGEYMKLPEIIELFAECGKILALLHNAGLYHRDTKPANFVVNYYCRDEVHNRVCLVDCDNVRAYNGRLPMKLRIRNVAQFIAGTGKSAKMNISQWQSVMEAFRMQYYKVAMMDKTDGDMFWNNVWDLIRKGGSIECNLPDFMLRKS